MSEECEEFFSITTAPDDYTATTEHLTCWVQRHAASQRKMALVTSGGTTVPLERNTVRFVDNFSLGTRGASSCEQLLKQGYAVVFLHRESSVQPFVRHLQPQVLLDAMAGVRREGRDGTAPQGTVSDATLTQGSASASITVTLDDRTSSKLRPVVSLYRSVVDDGRLLSLPFTSLTTYMWLLKAATCALEQHRGSQRPLLYLAAAVADFYIPSEQMPVHKLQSSSGPLHVSLQVVPKMLAPLVATWGPSLFVVTFKLETDVTKLLTKARGALKRYGHQLVVGNLLQTRRTEVTMVEMAAAGTTTTTTQDKDYDSQSMIERAATGTTTTKHDNEADTQFTDIATQRIKLSELQMRSNVEIEELIIDVVCSRHQGE